MYYALYGSKRVEFDVVALDFLDIGLLFYPLDCYRTYYGVCHVWVQKEKVFQLHLQPTWVLGLIRVRILIIRKYCCTL